MHPGPQALRNKAVAKSLSDASARAYTRANFVKYVSVQVLNALVMVLAGMVTII